ncbi:MAG: HAMP domain-containing histidine kinase [Candidatus Marinimicrobia bacterium]|nr:HAMP domain-containing histidine kinase [Candidatus Neomarinimicrobiota bacterium]
MKLRTKILSLTLIIVTVSFLFLSVPVYWYIKSALEDELDKRLLSIAEITANNVNKDLLRTLAREPALSNVRKSLEDNLMLFVSEQIDGLAIHRSDGKQLAMVEMSKSDNDLIFELIKTLIGTENKKGNVSELYKLSSGRYFKAAANPIFMSDDSMVFLVVWGGTDFMSEIDQITGIVFWIILITVGIAMGLAVIFSQSLLSPVKKLSEYTKLIKKNIYTDTITLNRKDEFGDLSQSLSEMHTEIKQNEQTMKQLLSGIAHEIKNPLGGMEIYSGLLQEELAKSNGNSTSDESLNFLGKITQEIQHLKQVVLEYLDYAKPLKSDLKPIHIESLIEDIYRILLPEMRQKKISYTLSGRGEVLADESKLRRVFLNLLKNSLEAVDEKGTIKVEIKNENSTTIIDVTDNGIGIPEDNMSQIFQPYFTTREKGYGLGLTIAKNIIDELNGTIIVKSQEGKTTTFTIELPEN